MAVLVFDALLRGASESQKSTPVEHLRSQLREHKKKAAQSGGLFKTFIIAFISENKTRPPDLVPSLPDKVHRQVQEQK